MKTFNVWTLVNINTQDIIYKIGPSAKDIWREVIQEEFLGIGHTIESLRAKGWRAKMVTIKVDK